MSVPFTTYKLNTNANLELNSNLNTYSSNLSTIVKTSTTQVSGTLNGFSMVGINGNKVLQMRGAIQAYINRIESNLNTIETKVSTTSAFKGEYAQAVKLYVQAIADATKAITSQLLIFKDQLVEIEKAYQQYDSELRSTFNTDSSSVESNYKSYQEKYPGAQ